MKSIISAIFRQRVKYNLELMFGSDWAQSTIGKRARFKR